MATINFASDEAARGFEANKPGWYEASIDTSGTVPAGSTANVTTSDTATLMKIAPYSRILDFYVEITTQEGATATADFGISGDDITNDPNGLDDAVNLNASAGTLTRGVFGTDAGMAVNFGASGGLITMNVDNDLDTAVFKIGVLVARGQDHA